MTYGDPDVIDRPTLSATLLDLRTARDLVREPEALKERYRALSPEEQEGVEELAASLEARGVRLLGLSDEGFPEGLKALRTPPAYLFALGNLALLERPAVGFSGSRDTGSDVIEVTRQCSRIAVESGFTVVSGLARGVDSAAHSGALDAGGETIGVAPEGILKFRGGAVAAGDDGAGLDPERFLVVSQFPADAKWMVGRAMTRNTTIIALSQCLILMSAQQTGGSFEAGGTALKMEAPLFVPSWPDGLSPGAADLERRGAVRVGSSVDLAQRLSRLGETSGQTDAYGDGRLFT